ncbi:MAG: ATP-binding protein [Bacteroidia bacterium]|nr:MAG: ATP-binding protein [Bacteroidia bacterium]
MVYKNFRLNVIVRVILLSLVIFVFFLLYSSNSYYITPILAGGIVLFLIYNLISYVEKTNKELTSFLQSIRFADFTRSFHIEGLGASFDELQKAFDDVIADFQKIRAEKEEHYYYLQNIIHHIGIGILAYQKDGTVEMINNAAKKLFQIYNLKNIKSLAEWSKEMEQVLAKIQAGENALVKVQDKDDLLQLSVYATEFKLNERTITLVSIKNIQTELEEKEMESWQKLIRVLTHEIMNSIAPIASLTSTSNLLVKEVAEAVNRYTPDDFDKEIIDDIQGALKTIHKRSTGLIHFVKTYRNLTKIPKPNYSIFQVLKMLENIKKLLQEELKKNNIHCLVSAKPPELDITADEQLIEQVIINMVQNSIHALEYIENPRIELRAFQNKRGKTTIQIIDNGQGIIDEVLDKVFIPFFTTKRSGSGIGLSLSKQILRLHGGSISVKSEPEIETCFTLTFNN